MPVIESFPAVAAADLAVTDVLYVRRPAQASGARDAKFTITALLKSFLTQTVGANKLLYGNGTSSLGVTDFPTLARSLVGRATAPLMRGDLGFATATADLNFGSINAAASEDLTIPVTGAVVGDAVHLGLPAAPTAGIIYQGFVSAANTVTVRATNITGSPINPALQTFRAMVIKSA